MVDNCYLCLEIANRIGRYFVDSRLRLCPLNCDCQSLKSTKSNLYYCSSRLKLVNILQSIFPSEYDFMVIFTHVKSSHPNSCEIFSCGIFSCEIFSCGIFSCEIFSCEIISREIVSSQLMWSLLMWHHLNSTHANSSHVKSSHLLM